MNGEGVCKSGKWTTRVGNWQQRKLKSDSVHTADPPGGRAALGVRAPDPVPGTVTDNF